MSKIALEGNASGTGTFTVAAPNTNTNYTITLPTSTGTLLTTGNTAENVQFGSLGVGTGASGTTGEIRATNNVTAYYSSDRKFKENIKPIEGAIDKVMAIGGNTFDWTDA